MTEQIGQGGGEDRRHRILDLLMDKGSVTVEELAATFGISRMTVHRDLDALAAEQLIRKVRGGATVESSLLFESDYRWRVKVAVAEKQAIARAAAELIEPGQAILLDAGTTVGAMIPFLVERRPLTVITNNLAIIQALATTDRITLVALGGRCDRRFNGFFGLLTDQMVGSLRADLAFMGATSLDGTTCFHPDQEIVKTKRAMLASARQAYLLVERSKFGQTALNVLAELSAFAGVITGTGLAPAHRRPLDEAAIRLIEAAG